MKTKPKTPSQKTRQVDLVETCPDGTMQLFELIRNSKPKAGEWPEVVEWMRLATNSNTFLRVVHFMGDDS